MESSKRTEDNITEFERRLGVCRRLQRDKFLSLLELPGQQTNQATIKPRRVLGGRYPKIKLFRNPRMPGGGAVPPPNAEKDKASDGPKHRWLKYMEDFVHFIPKDFPEDMGTLELDAKVTKNVTVALIDDGVDAFTRDMGDLSNRIKDGLSFDKTNVHHSASEFYSYGGHGTLMAKLILAVCPNADIVPYRVMIRPDKETGAPRPDPESAAKVNSRTLARRTRESLSVIKTERILMLL